MLWDGKSKGTVNNVVNLTRDHKPVIVYVALTRQFRTIKTFDDLKDPGRSVCSLRQASWMNAPSAFDEWYRERTLSFNYRSDHARTAGSAACPTSPIWSLAAPDGRRCHRRRRFSGAPRLRGRGPRSSPALGNGRNDYPASRNLSSQRNHTSNWFDLAPVRSTILNRLISSD